MFHSMMRQTDQHIIKNTINSREGNVGDSVQTARAGNHSTLEGVRNTLLKYFENHSAQSQSGSLSELIKLIIKLLQQLIKGQANMVPGVTGPAGKSGTGGNAGESGAGGNTEVELLNERGVSSDQEMSDTDERDIENNLHLMGPEDQNQDASPRLQIPGESLFKKIRRLAGKEAGPLDSSEDYSGGQNNNGIVTELKKMISGENYQISDEMLTPQDARYREPHESPRSIRYDLMEDDVVPRVTSLADESGSGGNTEAELFDEQDVSSDQEMPDANVMDMENSLHPIGSVDQNQDTSPRLQIPGESFFKKIRRLAGKEAGPLDSSEDYSGRQNNNGIAAKLKRMISGENYQISDEMLSPQDARYHEPHEGPRSIRYDIMADENEEMQADSDTALSPSVSTGTAPIRRAETILESIPEYANLFSRS